MLRKNISDLETNGQKGDWAFLKQDTWIAILYGENKFTSMVIIPVADKAKGNGNWNWNGNKESPTITPSIAVTAVPDMTEGWHGFLTDGKLITV